MITSQVEVTKKIIALFHNKYGPIVMQILASFFFVFDVQIQMFFDKMEKVLFSYII